MKFIFIIVLGGFTFTFFKGDILGFCGVLLLTLMGIISFIYLCNNHDHIFVYNLDQLGLYAAYYENLAYITLAHSSFNDVYVFILIIIGLSMLILNLFDNHEKPIGIKYSLILMFKNPKKVFFFLLVM